MPNVRKAKLKLRANRKRVTPPASRKVLATDPTRTATLRRSFLAELFRRFARVKGKIVKLIAGYDSLGLKPRPKVPGTNNVAVAATLNALLESPFTLSWEERTGMGDFSPVANANPNQARDERGRFAAGSAAVPSEDGPRMHPIGTKFVWPGLPGDHELVDFGHFSEMRAKYPVEAQHAVANLPEGVPESRLGRTWVLKHSSGTKTLVGKAGLSFMKRLLPAANQLVRDTPDEAASDADPNPTAAQREAGNYRKGHVIIQGIPITIETAKGVKRKPHHERALAHHYGYIKRTESEADGDHVDVFIGPNPDSDKVFVIDQYKDDSVDNANPNQERGPDGRWIAEGDSGGDMDMPFKQAGESRAMRAVQKIGWGKVETTKQKVDVDSLRATQHFLSHEASTFAGNSPILVVKAGGKLCIYDGHHRAWQAKAEGRKKIAAEVFDYDRYLAEKEPTSNVSPTFDEHKVMLGFDDEEAAIKGYHDSYPDDWHGFGGMTELTMDQFKRWLENGDTGSPIAGQSVANAGGGWDESQHLRDERGKFSAGEAASAKEALDRMPRSEDSPLRRMDWIEGTSEAGLATPFEHASPEMAAKMRDITEKAKDSQFAPTTLPMSSLTATQADVTRSVVEDKLSGKGRMVLPNVVKSGGKYYITDGHHSLVARHAAGQVEARVNLLDLDKPKGSGKTAVTPKTVTPKGGTEKSKEVEHLESQLKYARSPGERARLRRELKELTGNSYLGVGDTSFSVLPGYGQGQVSNTRWADLPDADKVEAFQDWLEQEFKNEGITGLSGEELWGRYINEGFRRGAGRAFDDVNRSALADAVSDSTGAKRLHLQGGRDQFLKQAFGQPVAVEKVKLLAGRAFDELEGITGEMSLKMSRALTDGLVTGASPHKIAKSITDQVDISRSRAETIARTEISRAHSSGQLLALKQLGVEEVGVMVEFTTAGDPCDECSALSGTVLKLDEAEGLIPQHPRCRCCWIPANVGEDTTGQVRDPEDIEDAFEEAGIPDDAQPDEIGERSYPDVDEDRPESLFSDAEEGGEDSEALDEEERAAEDEEDDLDIAMNFDPSQLRDPHGKWAKGDIAGMEEVSPSEESARGGTRQDRGPYVEHPFQHDGSAETLERCKQVLRTGSRKEGKVDLSSLIATQDVVRKGSVQYMKDHLTDKSHGYLREKLVVVKLDGKNYLYDGTHRASAAVASGVQKLPAVVYTPKRSKGLIGNADFDEAQHARDEKGRFASHPGAEHGSSVKIQKTKERAFEGDPVELETTLTKQETGRVGEAIGIAYLKTVMGKRDARPMNREKTNFPVDLIENGSPTEVKAGLASNDRKAQQWRLTFSKESAREKELYSKMNGKQRAAWNAEKQARIKGRKEAVIAALQKETGKKVTPRTLTVIVNPDKKVADVYIFSGFHDRIGWKSEEAKAAYHGSVKYDHSR